MTARPRRQVSWPRHRHWQRARWLRSQERERHLGASSVRCERPHQIHRKATRRTGSKTFIRHAQIVQGERDLRALELQDDEEGQEHLRQIHERVEHGWSVYHEIWAEAHKEFGPVGGNWVGKYRVKKERKNWDVNGALENVNTVNEALLARREGTQKEFLEKRRQEQREAELPRVSAMENPRASIEVPVSGRQESEVTVGNDEATAPLEGDEDLSESTAVETPDEVEKKRTVNGLEQKQGMNGSALPMRTHAATVA